MQILWLKSEVDIKISQISLIRLTYYFYPFNINTNNPCIHIKLKGAVILFYCKGVKGKMERKTMTNFRWKVAWLIFAISFVSYMDRVNLSVATPVIMQEFGFTKIDMGLIQSFFFAGYALFQVREDDG